MGKTGSQKRSRGVAGAARARGRSRRIWVLVAGAPALLAIGFLFGRLTHPASPLAPTAGAPDQASFEVAGSAGPPPSPSPTDLDGPSARAAEAPRGLVALVIDDLGRSVDVLDRLEALGVELSYSVLPFESMTGEVVAMLSSRRQEMLLHLPMEAGSDADPGPGALYAHMSARELVQGTANALAAVPGAIGVNNHMGSLLSSRRKAMRPVLELLRDRDLFFVDSRTSPRSVAFEVARKLGLPAVERDVFLDSEPELDKIRQQFSRLLERASSQGVAVAIGHPYDETLAVLAEEIPRALAAGYRFVPVSQLFGSDPGH